MGARLSYAQFTDEGACEKAEKLNCSIMYSDDMTLQLDLDSDEALRTFYEQIELLNSLGFLWDGYDTLPSKSGNTHVLVRLPQPVPIEERIALQAMLGSDRKREMLALAGLRAGQENPVLLFRPRFPVAFRDAPVLVNAVDVEDLF